MVRMKANYRSMTHDNDFSKPVRAHLNQSMFRETLLSYRLLFGQDESSRRLFNSHERAKVEGLGCLDPLLVQLCGEKTSLSQLVDHGAIPEQQSYDSTIDFPFYSGRLEALEHYIRVRKPRTLIDLWHDRRDPEKWVVIWVFLIVGGIKILISILQVGIAAAQLGVAVRQR